MANIGALTVIKNAEEDAKSLSEFLTKPANFMVSRRLAPTIHTLDYYLGKIDKAATDAELRAEQVINNVINNSGFTPVGTFAGGATLSKPNDVLEASDGKLYRWAGSLPKTVPASSTPENTGGFGSNAWLEVSDASLAQKLTTTGGASIIGDSISTFDNLGGFFAAEDKIRDGSKVFLPYLYQAGDLGEHGGVYTYSKTQSTGYINTPTNSGYLSREFAGVVYISEFGAGEVEFGYDENTAAMQSAVDFVNSKQGGTVKVGEGTTYCLGNFGEASSASSNNKFVLVDSSNITFDFTGSTIYMWSLGFAWFPFDDPDRYHHNVVFKGGTFIGKHTKTATAEEPTGFLCVSPVRVDGFVFKDVTVIEGTRRMHLLDIMGSKNVHVTHCNILGGGLEAGDTRECIQVSLERAGGTPFLIPNNRYSGYLGTESENVLVEHCVFKPYYNAEFNETSYVPRPLGDHNYTSHSYNIAFNNNYVEDPNCWTYTDIIEAPRAYWIAMFYNSFSLNDNTFVCKKGNPLVLRSGFHINKLWEVDGITSHQISVSGNTVKVTGEIEERFLNVDSTNAGGVFTLRLAVPSAASLGGTALAKEKYEQHRDTKISIKFNDNNISINGSVNGSKDYTPEQENYFSAIGVNGAAPQYHLEINRNIIETTCCYYSIYNESRDHSEYRASSSYDISDNKFISNNSKYCIHLQNYRAGLVQVSTSTSRISNNIFTGCNGAIFSINPHMMHSITGNTIAGHGNFSLPDGYEGVIVVQSAERGVILNNNFFNKISPLVPIEFTGADPLLVSPDSNGSYIFE